MATLHNEGKKDADAKQSQTELLKAMRRQTRIASLTTQIGVISDKMEEARRKSLGERESQYIDLYKRRDDLVDTLLRIKTRINNDDESD